MSDSEEHICDCCDERPATFFGADPFAAEIYGDLVESWWCDVCYGIRADGI